MIALLAQGPSMPVPEASFWVQLAQLGLGGLALYWLAAHLVPRMFLELERQQKECRDERAEMLAQAKDERAIERAARAELAAQIGSLPCRTRREG